MTSNVNVYPNRVIFDPLADVADELGIANDEQLVPAAKNAAASDGPNMFG